MVDNLKEKQMQNFAAGVNAVRVMRKAHTRGGVKYPATPTEYLVSLTKGKSIAIFREKDGAIQVCASFNVGDRAEYDAYNYQFIGEIESITDKTVTIAKFRGHSKKHRLDLYEFCWRNYNYDEEQIRKNNYEASMNT
jgi:hypothetical protein